MNISDLLGAMMQSGMTKPLDIQALIVAAKGRPTLAAQIYTASLLAIEVDTPPAKKKYLDQLAAGPEITPEVAQQIKAMVGLQA
jgi:uncharacterized membrane protein YebE (DUF533 family)